jgi:hypothetical protein
MVNEQNPTHVGKVGIVDGVLREGNANGWYGPVTLVEADRGAESQRLYRFRGIDAGRRLRLLSARLGTH